ncbi:MAG: TRAP transporter substrate-binding protein [Spirochaetia bacterium]|jgi:TRAP-type C4-dicarboxylate transport system substrate-binding protein|nr:TRAP transporter substrate-binding protein [Spirochaetia bacterium]
MKKTILFLAMLFAMTVFYVSCKKESGKNYYYEFSYSIFFPPTHAQTKAASDWADEIAKRTAGAVKINIFPSGTLTNANECYDGVVKGLSDLGMSCFSYTRGRFPVMEAADLPLGYPNGFAATRIVNEYYNTQQPDELKNVKVLYLHAHGPGLLHTKKPVRTLEELKGLKIRSTGLSAKVVDVLGGTPIAMSQGATYESLQRGVVEGTFTPIETLKDWRQAEVVKYTTDCSSVGYTTAMFVIINNNKWNALPDEIKKVFTDVSNEWIDIHGKAWDTADNEAKEYTKSLGNEILTLSPAESGRWAKAVEPVISDYINESKKKQGFDGGKAVSDLRKLIAAYSK